MQITQRIAGDVTILDLQGRLVFGDGYDALRDRLSRLVGEGRVNVLLNLDKVTVLDSSGVGLIACKYLTVRRHNGQLKLCNLRPRTHRVLNITKLLTVFESFESEAEALRNFSAPNAP
jgi:anti-sigma B factor antagonist